MCITFTTKKGTSNNVGSQNQWKFIVYRHTHYNDSNVSWKKNNLKFFVINV